MSQQEKANRAALNNLIKMGSDMEIPHPFEFFLYFPAEWNAYTAAAHLMNLQFKVSVSFCDYSDTWLCFAVKKIKPSTKRILELSRCLEDLAEEHNGNFDGWGTPVINENYPEA